MNILDDVLTPTSEELVTIEFLTKLQKRLGFPPDLESQAGLKLMDAVIGVWQKHFPQEAEDWLHDVKMDLDNEKSVSELIKDSASGYNPVGYPPKLFDLIRNMFPEIKLQERKVFTKLVEIYPGLFKTSNYI